MNTVKYFLTLFFLLCTFVQSKAQMNVTSPDGSISSGIIAYRIRQSLTNNIIPERMVVYVRKKRQQVVRNQEISITVKSEGHRYSFSKSEVNSVVHEKLLTDSPQNTDPLLSDLKGQYNLMRITSSGIVLELRAYNNGIAYRFLVLGFPGEYKILDVTDPFPNDKGMAVYGTFTGKKEMPWRTLIIDNNQTETLSKESADLTDAEQNISQQPVEDEYRKQAIRFLPWKDALQSISVGVYGNWFKGGLWKDVGMNGGVAVDYTYKYIYTGINYTPCGQIMYIIRDRDYYPFEDVVGAIHVWGIGGRVGFNVPFQTGYNVWNLSPYVAYNLLHLTQHGSTVPGYVTVNPHHRHLVGPGIKLQTSIRGNFTFGVNYEYLFFKSPKSAYGNSVIGLSMGKQF